MSKYDEVHPTSAYVSKAIEWLALAKNKSSVGNHDAASTYVEGAKVYAALAETARKCMEDE